MESQLPPLSLEEAADELLRLEEIIANTRDSAEGARLILLNLILFLKQSGVLNGTAFAETLRNVQRGIDKTEDMSTRVGLEANLVHLLPLLEMQEDIESISDGEVH